MMFVKKNKRYIFLTLLIIIGIPLMFYSLTFAKYVSNSIWDYYLQSRGFYFSSDQLGKTTVQNVNNLWDGGSIHFNIKNSLNQNVITSYDIGYLVSCTIKGEAANYVSCNLNGEGSNTGEGVLSSFQTCTNNTGDGIDVSTLNKTDCELSGYEWVNQLATKDLYFDISLNDDSYEIKDIVANITVTSTYPYRKSINGDFILHKRNALEEAVTMNYKSYTNYDRLVISNSYPNKKCVQVMWNPEKLIIDADETKFNSHFIDVNNYISGVKFNIEGKKSVSYIFYKRNFDEMYNVNEFTLIELDDC